MSVHGHHWLREGGFESRGTNFRHLDAHEEV